MIEPTKAGESQNPRSQPSPSESTEQPGLEGNLYGITVLPENMGQWVDEIYKRKVPIAEAKEVAEYLVAQEYSRALDAALKALPEHHSTFAPYTPRESETWHKAIDQARRNITKLKEPSND